MKIALATTADDPLDPRSWSGTPHAIHSALQRCGDTEVVCLGPLDPGLRLPEGAKKYYWKLKGQRYLWEREPRIAAIYREQFAAGIAKHKPDVILSLGTIPAASLPDGTARAVYVDSTFELNLDYYPTMTNICRPSQLLGELVDREAFSRADHVIATSEWAASSIRTGYGVPGDRVSVVPIGAQHVSTLSGDEIRARSADRLRGPLKLLWVGVEWERKGGDIAVEIAGDLHSRGVDVELHIVGLTPREEICRLPFVTAHGFIDARKDKGRLEELFLQSLALLLPSRAENTSVAISDSASFGVPVFASDTGGMPTMIVDGVNGETLPAGTDPSVYATRLLGYAHAPEAYAALVGRTRARFESELSWDVGIAAIRSRLAALVAARRQDGAIVRPA